MSETKLPPVERVPPFSTWKGDVLHADSILDWWQMLNAAHRLANTAKGARGRQTGQSVVVLNAKGQEVYRVDVLD